MFKKLFFLTLLCAVSATSFAAEPVRPEVADSVKAWQGNEGIEVWTLRYGPRSENKALVQITNADHDWDKKIQIMDVEKKDERSDYSVNVNGKKIVVLIINNNNLGKLYLPGEKGDHPIMYSELLSNEGNAQYFLTDFLKQETKPQS
ncbi:hypothetical protein RF657_14970 [Yersinia rochesterensis]|uniref:hypothetical protein n=1 Tax=Yersinia rochesterensis TaxID=1604335 RepID=UPI0028535417|nr:hypothetical protein [Yersinia rochesterensis]MDR5019690.1 hypothetical protein [Yersinia rochesterensis]